MKIASQQFLLLASVPFRINELTVKKKNSFLDAYL